MKTLFILIALIMVSVNVHAELGDDISAGIEKSMAEDQAKEDSAVEEIVVDERTVVPEKSNENCSTYCTPTNGGGETCTTQCW